MKAAVYKDRWASHQERGRTANRVAHCLSLDIDQNILNITPHQLCGYTECSKKVLFVCVYKIDNCSLQIFFPSRMEINSFHIFQHPTTHHVYSLLLIKLSGNLNTSQLENIFPNSKPYLPVRVSIQAGIPGHRKECLLVPRSTAQVLFCWAFFHFRRFFCWLVWGQFSKTLLTFSIRTLSKCQS